MHCFPENQVSRQIAQQQRTTLRQPGYPLPAPNSSNLHRSRHRCALITSDINQQHANMSNLCCSSHFSQLSQTAALPRRFGAGVPFTPIPSFAILERRVPIAIFGVGAAAGAEAGAALFAIDTLRGGGAGEAAGFSVTTLSTGLGANSLDDLVLLGSAFFAGVEGGFSAALSA